MSDICLVLEGTYPYITGGVSSWVHDIISNLNEFSFDIVTILPNKDYATNYKYKIPNNVKSIYNIYLNDINYTKFSNLNYIKRKKFFDKLTTLILRLKDGEYHLIAEIVKLINFFNPNLYDLVHTKESWEFVVKMYQNFDDKFSFIDFFWTQRFILLPLINLINCQIPNSSVYHTISTGYAGLLASMFSLLTTKPMILTEHGIYTNERLIEIIDAQWIYDDTTNNLIDIMRDIAPLKKLWINFFLLLGKIAYHCASEIITLFYENMLLQIKLGALKEKCKIIPNGIDCERFSKKRTKVPQAPNYIVGYSGRIVQIKDIKTLLHAARYVVDKLPNTKFILMGPTDEEKLYYEECQTLTHILGLEKSVEFVGPGNTAEFYPNIDLLVLSSISEAQPLSLMEANLCRVPVVATDVGACRELLYGFSKDDVEIGQSGIVVPIKAPEALGDAIIKLLTDVELNIKMGLNGEKRILKYYQKKDLISKYKKLYEENILKSKVKNN